MRCRDSDEHDVLADDGRLQCGGYANAVAGSRDEVVADHVVMAGENLGAWQVKFAEAYHAYPKAHAPPPALVR